MRPLAGANDPIHHLHGLITLPKRVLLALLPLQTLTRLSSIEKVLSIYQHSRPSRPSLSLISSQVQATTRLFAGTQKARAWEAAQEEKILNSKWYNRCLDCLTCYSPEIETAQQARRPDPQNWSLGLCDCVKYRNVQGRGVRRRHAYVINYSF
jgi:hypothetical protein